MKLKMQNNDITRHIPSSTLNKHFTRHDIGQYTVYFTSRDYYFNSKTNKITYKSKGYKPFFCYVLIGDALIWAGGTNKTPTESLQVITKEAIEDLFPESRGHNND